MIILKHILYCSQLIVVHCLITGASGSESVVNVLQLGEWLGNSMVVNSMFAKKSHLKKSSCHLTTTKSAGLDGHKNPRPFLSAPGGGQDWTRIDFPSVNHVYWFYRVTEMPKKLTCYRIFSWGSCLRHNWNWTPHWCMQTKQWICWHCHWWWITVNSRDDNINRTSKVRFPWLCSYQGCIGGNAWRPLITATSDKEIHSVKWKDSFSCTVPKTGLEWKNK